MKLAGRLLLAARGLGLRGLASVVELLNKRMPPTTININGKFLAVNMYWGHACRREL